MRMIKVGEKYLGLVDRQRDALQFAEDRAYVVPVAASINAAAIVNAPDVIGQPARVVKLTTLADRTADSMRGLADDVNGGGDQS